MWYITIDQSTQFAKSIPGCQFSNGHPILAVFYGVELGSFGVWDSTTQIFQILLFFFVSCMISIYVNIWTFIKVLFFKHGS